MKLIFAERVWEDYLYWQRCDPASAKDARERATRQDTDKKTLRRINTLIKDIQRNPFEGIGDPEPLKYNWSGFWSRRITKEHRLVYAVEKDSILIAQCRFHY
ncbi:MAG: Txe/YoeB family addiction module toxin [Xenococcaceae cyanobacterium]